MTRNEACDIDGGEQKAVAYETIAIEKTRNVCPFCEDYTKRHTSKPIAVMCCEGSCLRGEIARRAANLICHKLAPDKTVRICLGGAFTKDTGQRMLVRNAPKVVVAEGCFIACASRMMRGVLPDLDAEVIFTDKLCDFDSNLFGVDEMPEDRINKCAEEAANKIAAQL